MANILVMEDDEQQLELLRYMLTRRGHAVVTTLDASEAYKKFCERKFDLVVTDIVVRKQGTPFPDGGTTLIRRIRTGLTGKNIPIIAVTGARAMEHPRIIKSIRTDWVSDILRKPFDMASLLKAVDAALGQGSERTPRAERSVA
ncbi:MAG: response regulator [Pseudomonadota bacterium]